MILGTQFDQPIGTPRVVRQDVHGSRYQGQEISRQRNQTGNQNLEVQRDRIESRGDIGSQVDREQDDQNLPKGPYWR